MNARKDKTYVQIYSTVQYISPNHRTDNISIFWEYMRIYENIY